MFQPSRGFPKTQDLFTASFDLSFIPSHGGLITMQTFHKPPCSTASDKSGSWYDFYLALPLLLFGSQGGTERLPLPVHTPPSSLANKRFGLHSSDFATHLCKISFPGPSHPPACTSLNLCCLGKACHLFCLARFLSSPGRAQQWHCFSGSLLLVTNFQD